VAAPRTQEQKANDTSGKHDEHADDNESGQQVVTPCSACVRCNSAQRSHDDQGIEEKDAS
jgi:hypothetical protein